LKFDIIFIWYFILIVIFGVFYNVLAIDYNHEEDLIKEKLLNYKDMKSSIMEVAIYLGFSELNVNVNKEGIISLKNGEKRQVYLDNSTWKIKNLSLT
jgi:hypothetical protein